MSVRTAQLGVARYGAQDLHHVHSHSHGSTAHIARCGVFITLTDDPPALHPMCEECATGQRRPRHKAPKPRRSSRKAEPVERTMRDVWQVCATWDARYNGSIRNLDAKPLGSILDG